MTEPLLKEENLLKAKKTPEGNYMALDEFPLYCKIAQISESEENFIHNVRDFWMKNPSRFYRAVHGIPFTEKKEEPPVRNHDLPILDQLKGRELDIWITTTVWVIKTKEEFLSLNSDCGFTEKQLKDFWEDVRVNLSWEELNTLREY